MKIWNQAPLVRLLLPFLVGIVAAVYAPHHFNLLLLVSCFVFIAIAALVLIPKFNLSYRHSFWFGGLINILLFLFAYQLTLYKTEKFAVHHFSHFTHSKILVQARVCEETIRKEKSVKAILEIIAIKAEGGWRSTSGKAVVYFKTDSNATALTYGDELLMHFDFKEVSPPQNPGEFNYKRFLSFHNIYHQAYANTSDWKPLSTNSGNTILKYCIGLRSKLLGVLKNNQLTGDELAVGAALLLGYTDKLDAELISAYSSTGALHVLSVSGLHVAIVYMVMNWLLFLLDKHKKTRFLKTVLLLLFLWFYAALTGLSPSVLRAATMFSFIVVAKATNKHTNIYNTLAASALFLLLINPYLLMEVGFQLSYLAVIGIVYIQPKIYEWFTFDNWLLDQIWMITAVSMAAQLATFPLGLHYFHQFPNYFFISNLIVIPLSTLILYVGIAVFVFSEISVVVNYLAMAFAWLIWFLNASVKWMESLPFSLLQGISISVAETWLLYGLIVLILFYLNNRNYKFLMLALSAVILILISQVIEQQKQSQQKKMVIYSIPKTTAIDFIHSRENVLLTDTAFAENKSGLLFRVKHNWWDLGLTTSEVVSGDVEREGLKIHGPWIQFFNTRIYVLSQAIQWKESTTEKPTVDYIVVSKNVKMSIEEIRRVFQVKTLVFDLSNSAYKIKQWKKECEVLHQEYYSIADEGAFEVVLNDGDIQTKRKLIF
ncbi:MAG: ComEC family competence protein [Bacteroidetes bacterium]|nr:ComEC family competence protein [Bacteroidota bacterium]